LGDDIIADYQDSGEMILLSCFDTIESFVQRYVDSLEGENDDVVDFLFSRVERLRELIRLPVRAETLDIVSGKGHFGNTKYPDGETPKEQLVIYGDGEKQKPLRARRETPNLFAPWETRILGWLKR